jgi:hypothetical protein
MSQQNHNRTIENWPPGIQFDGSPGELKFLLEWQLTNTVWDVRTVISEYADISQKVKNGDVPIYKVQVVEDLIREFRIPILNHREDDYGQSEAMFQIDEIYKHNQQHLGKNVGTGRRHRDIKLMPKQVD